MTEENNIHKQLEGKLDASHILVSIISSMGGTVEIKAQDLFSSIQVDRILVLEYNDENNTYKVSIQQANNTVEEQNEESGN